MPFGRQLQAGPTDMAAAARVPLQPLRLIPAAARGSFTPYLPTVPSPRAGEDDMTRIGPGRPRAQGVAMEVSGRVTDDRGRPLRQVLIEIWNANTWGRYTHEDDPAREPIDPNFIGIGRVLTDDEGRYRFWTIRPAAYLARPDIDRWRPAHIHMSLRGGATRMITQCYFDGDPHLARDPCWHLLGDAAPRHLLQSRADTPADVEAAFGFDIVVGGRNATFFG